MENKIVEVTNRSSGKVLYVVPEMGIRREFYPRETKKVNIAEIEAVSSQPGGRELIYHYLLVKDQDALRDSLNVKEEPEYWFTEEKIPSWIVESSLDEFKDALDFAPEGVKELIKQYSVSLPLNDMNKRIAIQEQLGFDVNAAIAHATPDATEEVPQATTSRRRVSTPEYKIVSKK